MQGSRLLFWDRSPTRPMVGDRRKELAEVRWLPDLAGDCPQAWCTLCPRRARSHACSHASGLGLGAHQTWDEEHFKLFRP